MASSSSTSMCVGAIPSQGEEKSVMVSSTSISMCECYTHPGRSDFHGKMSHVIFRDIKISGTNHGALMVVDSEPRPQEVLMRYKETILSWAKY